MSGPAGRLDAVLVCGGKWHDFDFARLELLHLLHLDEHVRTRVFEDYGGIGRLDGVDALITYTCDVRPDAIQQQALADFVRAGGRWLALHGTNSAIDAPTPGLPKRYRTPRALGEVAKVLGSQFLGHPPIEPYLVAATRDHPLVAGIEPFPVSDELYICELQEDLDVLLHTRYSGQCPGFDEGHVTDDDIRPVLYLHPYGEGTVCYFTLGHCRGRFDMQDAGIDDLGRVDRGSWESPSYRTVLDRCIRWALHGEVGGGAGPRRGRQHPRHRPNRRRELLVPPWLSDLVEWTGEQPALVGSRCPTCGTHTFPRQGSCPRCSATGMADVRLPTSGTVWTWTVQRFPVKPPFRAPEPFEPFALGYVDLGVVRVETRLVGRALDAWSIGDEVELGVELLPGEHADAPDARAAFVFRPVRAEVAA